MAGVGCGWAKPAVGCCRFVLARIAITPRARSLRLPLQGMAQQRCGVLRNIAEYQGMPLLRELAEWQLGGGGSGSGHGH